MISAFVGNQLAGYRGFDSRAVSIHATTAWAIRSWSADIGIAPMVTGTARMPPLPQLVYERCYWRGSWWRVLHEHGWHHTSMTTTPITQQERWQIISAQNKILREGGYEADVVNDIWGEQLLGQMPGYTYKYLGPIVSYLLGRWGESSTHWECFASLCADKNTRCQPVAELADITMAAVGEPIEGGGLIDVPFKTRRDKKDSLYGGLLSAKDLAQQPPVMWNIIYRAAATSASEDLLVGLVRRVPDGEPIAEKLVAARGHVIRAAWLGRDGLSEDDLTSLYEDDNRKGVVAARATALSRVWRDQRPPCEHIITQAIVEKAVLTIYAHDPGRYLVGTPTGLHDGTVTFDIGGKDVYVVAARIDIAERADGSDIVIVEPGSPGRRPLAGRRDKMRREIHQLCLARGLDDADRAQLIGTLKLLLRFDNEPNSRAKAGSC